MRGRILAHREDPTPLASAGQGLRLQLPWLHVGRSVVRGGAPAAPAALRDRSSTGRPERSPGTLPAAAVHRR